MAKDDDAAGGPQRVERTGIALVHEGERIYATEEAAAALVPQAARTLHYYFPVEVEVLGPAAAQAMAEQIYDALLRELASLG
jgi:hypothetical protein